MKMHQHLCPSFEVVAGPCSATLVEVLRAVQPTRASHSMPASSPASAAVQFVLCSQLFVLINPNEPAPEGGTWAPMEVLQRIVFGGPPFSPLGFASILWIRSEL